MKEAAGLVTIFLSLVGYIPYLRDIAAGKTKPHAFTWIVWTIITFIIGVMQLAAGSGWGAIHNIVTGFVCLIIVYFAVRNHDKDIKKVDVYIFCAALAAIPLWLVTKNPTYSVVLITLIDAVSFIPTLRKTWHDPGSETLISYVLAGAKYCVAIAAITTYGIGTLLYPLALMAMNIIMISVMALRKGKAKKHPGITPGLA